MASREPTTAPMAYPFDMALASVVMSGVTPVISWIPPIRRRQPQETSSKISSASCSRASRFTDSR